MESGVHDRGISFELEIHDSFPYSMKPIRSEAREMACPERLSETFSWSTTQTDDIRKPLAKLSAPIRFPRWRASGACHRTDRPFPRDGDHPYGGPVRPCGGHSKGQGLFGHHSHPADHRTLQAFYHHIPSSEVETWGDDHRLQHGDQAT